MDPANRIIEFSNSNFPVVARDEELANPDTMHGYLLAEHIASGIKPQGYAVTHFNGEDWGWLCEVANPDFNLWYGVASYDRSNDFMIQFHPQKSIIRKMFRKIDVSKRLLGLQSAIFQVLRDTDGNLKAPEWVAG